MLLKELHEMSRLYFSEARFEQKHQRATTDYLVDLVREVSDKNSQQSLSGLAEMTEKLQSLAQSREMNAT